MFISLYTTRVILKVLGAEDYGIYNVVCGFVSMFGIFNICFSTSINRFYNYEIGKKTENGVRDVYNVSVLIQLILALSIVLLIELVGGWYIDNVMILPAERLSTAKWIFHFSMISMFLTIMQAPYSAAVMAYERMDYYALVSILNTFLKLGFIIMLQYIGNNKLLIYGVLMCIISMVDFLMFFVYCRLNFSQIKLCRGIDKNKLKQMLSFSGWSVLDPATYVARDQGINMVLNSFFGPVVNAAQGIALQIASAVENLGGSFSISFRPQIIQSYSEGQHKRCKNLMFSMSKISFMLHTMFVIPIILEINYLLQLWLGEDAPAYATSFACLILCVKCIDSLNTPISTVISAVGKIKKIKVFSAIVIASIIPLSIVLLRFDISPIYIYVTLFFLSVINQSGCVIILSQLFPDVTPMEYIKRLAFPLLIYTMCSVVLPLFISLLLPSTIWRLILVGLTSVISTTCMGYWIILNKTEKGMVRMFVENFLQKFRWSK